MCRKDTRWKQQKFSLSNLLGCIREADTLHCGIQAVRMVDAVLEEEVGAKYGLNVS